MLKFILYNKLRMNFFCKNKIEIKNSKVKKNIIKIEGKNNSIRILANSKIKNSEIILKGENIKLLIKEKVILENSKVEIYGDDNIIEIGKNTSFQGVRITSAEKNNKIIIGDNCLFSYNIDIRNTDSHSIFQNEKEINLGRIIEIKNRVWVCEGVSILKGVIIESGCIIGAKSLINKNILEKNVIVAGNPQRIIKRGIVWKE